MEHDFLFNKRNKCLFISSFTRTNVREFIYKYHSMSGSFGRDGALHSSGRMGAIQGFLYTVPELVFDPDGDYDTASYEYTSPLSRVHAQASTW